MRRRLSRFFLWLPILLIAFVILFFSVFQIPKVQTKLVNKVSFLISENTGFAVSIGHANLTWFDHMIVKNIKLYDHQNDSTLISVSELQINVSIYDFLMERKLKADKLELNSPYLHVIKSDDSTAVNISRFLSDLKNVFKKNRKNKEKKTSIFLNTIVIRDGTFSYNDLTADEMAQGKDYRHFEYDSIQAELSNFSFVNDSIGLKINSFNSIDPKGQLNIRELESQLSFTKKQMIFSNLQLKTDQSLIGDSIVFNYQHPSNFKYFSDSIFFESSFKNSIVSTQELALFSPSLNKINRFVEFSGELSGSVKKLRARNFELGIGRDTNFSGNIELLGLPVISETFINLDVKKSTIAPNDIDDLVNDNLREKIHNVGQVNFSGRFQGFLSDFVADAQVFSPVGQVKTDINFKIDEKNKAWYKGSLTLTSFDLRSIFPNQDQLKHITLNGKIKGSGLKLDNANFNLNAHIDSVYIANYAYKKVVTNGKFELGFFDGELAAADPNLSFQSNIEIDLRNNKNKINLQADLNRANLQPLQLTKQNLQVSSRLDIDLKGFRTDDLIGYVSLYNNQIRLDEKTMEIDSVKLLSSLINENRVIHLDTDGLTIQMDGKFRNSVFLRTIKEFYQEVRLNILNNEADINSYYSAKSNLDLEPYDVQIDINFGDVNKFIQPFYPSIQISKELKLHGSFIQDSTSKLSLYGEVDTLKIDEISWMNNKLDVNIAKEYFDKNTTAEIDVSSKNQIWSEKYSSENILAKLNWIRDSMSVFLNIEQPAHNNQMALETSVLFLTDSTLLRFNPSSDIKVLDKIWNWDAKNQIIYNKGEWNFSSVKASNGIEKLEISGAYSDDPSKSLFIDFKEINIENIQSVLTSNMSGILDGRIGITKQLDTEDLIEGNLVARSVKIGDFPLGNIFGISTWNNEQKSLAINLDLIHDSKKKIEVKGLYFPKNETDQLDLQAKFDSADLKIAEPFLKKNFTELKGIASGEFSIHGSLKYPILKGKGKVTNGGVLVNYLNTRYTFHGDLLFEENEISTQKLTLFDSDQNTGTLSGGIFHDGFKNGVLDFQGEFENFKLLNTTSADNDAYYGVAYGTGTVNFLGAVNNIQITAEAQTAKGTRLSIPLSTSSESRIEQKEYIEFVDLGNQETAQVVIEDASQKEKLKIKGIELDFDIEFTPDAYVELIFDVQAGDIIRGRGNGNIKLQINTDGDFAMFGDYTIENGGYNFTLYNIINKEFEIKKGSTISWYGDPYGANLNISASYRQLTSLAPLMVKFLDPDDLNSPETRKKYPSIVDLQLKGNLLTPEIKFNIDIREYPQTTQLPNSSATLDEVVTAFKAELRNNEQEMNRQVFSLIVLRKFSQENSFQVNSQTISNSLSEFVSNQLSYWATQVDENLEVDVDLAGLSDDAFNTFQLRLSYTFLDGRLRVTRGGSLPNQETKGDVSTIIGDWTVEYLLTEDGRFRVKMYSRSDLDAISQQSGESNFETGFSLQYIKSFDHLSQILSDNRKRNISQKKVTASSADEKEI